MPESSIKKKLIDTGLRYDLSMDLEIRFWTVSPVKPGLRISDIGANPRQSTCNKNIQAEMDRKSITALFCCNGFYGCTGIFSEKYILHEHIHHG
jgi:hypothetical protein